MGGSPRAAIIGYGRIGRHHAKWYHQLGCDLVGLSARRDESLAAGAADLRELTSANVPGFASIDALLDTVEPDLVSVCTPAEAHYETARAALDRGVAVLCEKPLCWADEPAAALLSARALVELARERDRPLAVNLQYGFAAAAYRELVTPTRPASTCSVTLESKGKGTAREADEIWMELGPHALSLVFALLPGGRVYLDTLDVATSPRRVEVSFELGTADGPVGVSVECGQRPEGTLVRRFGLDDQLVDLSGRNNATGEYRTYLRFGQTEREYPDLMRQSIAAFVDRVAGRGGLSATDGVEGVSNLEVQIVVAEALVGEREGRNDG